MSGSADRQQSPPGPAAGGSETESTLGDEWVRDLESALNSDSGCEFSQVREIAQNRPFKEETMRAKAWAVLLGVANKPDPFAEWDQLYDLPDQARVRQLCQQIVDRMGNPESDRIALTSDLESVLTLFCKTRKCSFDDITNKSKGWADVLQLLLVLNMPRTLLFHVFHAFVTKYIPQGCKADGKPFDLFRLLLLYHDPALCSFLDTRKITPDMYAMQWFNGLFASIADLNVTLGIWDVYLQQADPFSVFFMALVMLINAKEQILEMGADQESGERIAETVSGFPKQLDADDIADFCHLTAIYATRTPQSFRRDYHGPLFGSNLADEFESVTVHSLLCLPVSVQELLRSNQVIDTFQEDVHYFVVDGRPMSQYKNGHLPGAFNLDCSLLVNSPAEFHLAVQSLGAFKAKTHPDDHICFMGSGRDQEDQFVHMVIASFLQKHTKHVSLARGGYAALHDVLRESLSTRLRSHNAKSCLQCSRNNATIPVSSLPSPMTPEAPPSLFNRVTNLTKAVKEKSTQVTGYVKEYITNPQQTSPDIRHADSKDRHQKRYRESQSAFSIGDEDDSSDDDDDDGGVGIGSKMAGDNNGQASSSGHKEKVKLSDYMKKPDIVATFAGHQIEHAKQSYMRSCHLAITRTHLHVLHDCLQPSDKGYAFVHLRRPLASVFKMTSKKRMPELLTVKYGYELTPGQHKITGVDKFVIENSGDCAKALKSAIFALLEPTVGANSATANALPSQESAKS